MERLWYKWKRRYDLVHIQHLSNTFARGIISYASWQTDECSLCLVPPFQATSKRELILFMENSLTSVEKWYEKWVNICLEKYIVNFYDIMIGNSFHNCEIKAFFFMMLQIGHCICLCKNSSYLHISGGVVMVHRVPVHHPFWTLLDNNFHLKLMETLCKILEFFQWCTIGFKTLRRPSLWNILGFTKQIMQKNGNLQNATTFKG